MEREESVYKKTPGDYIDQLTKIHPQRTKWIADKWMHDYGKPLTWMMQFIGITGAITNLYVELDSYDQLYKSKKISSAELESKRENAFGVFSTQIVAPAIARLITNSSVVRKLAGILRMIIGLFGSKFTKLATAVGVGASEAFIAWLTVWIGSKEGQEWLSGTFIMSIVRTFGTIEDHVWSSLSGYYDNKDKTPGAESEPSNPTTSAQTSNQNSMNSPANTNPNYDPLTAPLGSQPAAVNPMNLRPKSMAS